MQILGKDSQLEMFCVAGQYDGRSKPLPEYHAKITGFDERVRSHAVYNAKRPANVRHCHPSANVFPRRSR